MPDGRCYSSVSTYELGNVPSTLLASLSSVLSLLLFQVPAQCLPCLLD
jgi:hypothetical protein